MAVACGSGDPNVQSGFSNTSSTINTDEEVTTKVLGEIETTSTQATTPTSTTVEYHSAFPGSPEYPVDIITNEYNEFTFDINTIIDFFHDSVSDFILPVNQQMLETSFMQENIIYPGVNMYKFNGYPKHFFRMGLLEYDVYFGIPNNAISVTSSRAGVYKIELDEGGYIYVLDDDTTGILGLRGPTVYIVGVEPGIFEYRFPIIIKDFPIDSNGEYFFEFGKSREVFIHIVGSEASEINYGWRRPDFIIAYDALDEFLKVRTRIEDNELVFIIDARGATVPFVITD